MESGFSRISCSSYRLIVHVALHQDQWQRWRSAAFLSQKPVMGQCVTWYLDKCASSLLSSCWGCFFFVFFVTQYYRGSAWGSSYIFWFFLSMQIQRQILLIGDTNSWERVEDDKIRQSFDPAECCSWQGVCRACEFCQMQFINGDKQVQAGARDEQETVTELWRCKGSLSHFFLYFIFPPASQWVVKTTSTWKWKTLLALLAVSVMVTSCEL